MPIPPPTGTPRLLFEPLGAGHAAELFGALCHPLVYEHLGEPPPESVAALAERYAFIAAGPPGYRAHETWINYAVRLRATAALIGRVEATIVDVRAETAYLLDPAHWGQGYATEAMSAFQNHLRQNERVMEFWATTSPQNARSIALLRRLGYRQVVDSWPPLLSYDAGDLVFTCTSQIGINTGDGVTEVY